MDFINKYDKLVEVNDENARDVFETLIYHMKDELAGLIRLFSHSWIEARLGNIYEGFNDKCILSLYLSIYENENMTIKYEGVTITGKGSEILSFLDANTQSEKFASYTGVLFKQNNKYECLDRKHKINAMVTRMQNELVNNSGDINSLRDVFLHWLFNSDTNRITRVLAISPIGSLMITEASTRVLGGN